MGWKVSSTIMIKLYCDPVASSDPTTKERVNRDTWKAAETYAFGTTEASLGKNEAPIGIVGNGGR